MYARHFDLSKDPFSIAPDPRFLFMSERHREALAHLLFGVSGTGGFVLFTGDIGTGKTTVCRCFLEQVPPNCKVALVFNPRLSVLELLASICQEFHVALPAGERLSLKDYVDALNVFLLQSHAAGQSNVLIVDEAQNLPAGVLEQLRLLTNLETHERKLLQIVLIGQPELRTMLERPELEQLAQRVVARYHLQSLSAEETLRYIEHRLSVAGHTGALPFDAAALRRIHKLTRGVPRRINLLCGRVLLGAWANGLHQVSLPMVNKAAQEVFGDAPAPSRAHLHARAALWLGLVGVLCMAVALGWQLSPFAAPRVHTVIEPSVLAARTAPALAAPSSAVAAMPALAARGAPVALEDMELLLPTLPTEMAPAWRELAQHPGLDWDLAAAPPCQPGATARWQCYRTKELSFPLLRQLDRPGVLVLQKTEDQPRYAVLDSLNDKTATLRWSGASHQVSLISLARFWRGEFATVWLPPAGYGANLREAEPSPVYGRLAQQLAQLEGAKAATGAPAAVKLDGALLARLKAFQKGQGIKADGVLGPMTFMQLDKALGVHSSNPVPENR